MESKWLEEFAKGFTLKRAVNEGTAQPEVSVLPLPLQYVALVYTGTVTNHFYIQREEILEYSRPLHRLMYQANKDMMRDVIRDARQVGIKDQVLMGAFLLRDIETLATFPPSQINKLRSLVPSGLNPLGSKNAVREVITEWVKAVGKDRLLYYATSHRGQLRKLLFVWSNSLRKYVWYPLTAVDKEVLDVLMKPVDLDKADAVDFNYLVSTVPKEEWGKYIDKVHFTPYVLLSYAKSLASVLGEDFVVGKLTTAKYLTSDKYFRAMLVLKDSYPKVAEKLKELYVKSASESYKEMVMPGLQPNKVVLVLDVSGSMREVGYKVMGIVSPFAPLVKDMILFSTDYYHEDPKKLLSVDGVTELLQNAPWGGTNVRGALEEARRVAGEEDVIMVVTDEQENVDVNKKVVTPHVVVNPKPYPSHMPFDTKYVFVPGTNAESLASAYRLTQVLRLNPTENFKIGK